MKVGDLLYCNAELGLKKTKTSLLQKNRYYPIVGYDGKNMILRGENVDIEFKDYKNDIMFKKHIFTPLKMRKQKLQKLKNVL
jgi:hypothetical protein